MLGPNGACIPCIAGTYSHKKGSVCLQCPGNTFSADAGARDCVLCPPNQYSPTGASGCSPDNPINVNTAIVPISAVPVTNGSAWAIISRKRPIPRRWSHVVIRYTSGLEHRIGVNAFPPNVTLSNGTVFSWIGTIRPTRDDTVYNISVVDMDPAILPLYMYSIPSNEQSAPSYVHARAINMTSRSSVCQTAVCSGTITASSLDTAAQWCDECNAEQVRISSHGTINWNGIFETDTMRTSNCTYTTRLIGFSVFNGTNTGPTEFNFPVMHTTSHPYGIFVYMDRIPAGDGVYIVLDQWESGPRARILLYDVGYNVSVITARAKAINALTGGAVTFSVAPSVQMRAYTRSAPYYDTVMTFVIGNGTERLDDSNILLGYIEMPGVDLLHLVIRVISITVTSGSSVRIPAVSGYSNILRLRDFRFSDWFTCTGSSRMARRTIGSNTVIDGADISVIQESDGSITSVDTNCMTTPIRIQLHEESMTAYPCIAPDDGDDMFHGVVTDCTAITGLAAIRIGLSGVCVFILRNADRQYSVAGGAMIRVFTVVLSRMTGQTNADYYNTAAVKWAPLSPHVMTIPSDRFRSDTNDRLPKRGIFYAARYELCHNDTNLGICDHSPDGIQELVTFSLDEIMNPTAIDTVAVIEKKSKSSPLWVPVVIGVSVASAFLIGVLLLATTTEAFERLLHLGGYKKLN